MHGGRSRWKAPPYGRYLSLLHGEACFHVGVKLLEKKTNERPVSGARIAMRARKFFRRRYHGMLEVVILPDEKNIPPARWWLEQTSRGTA